MSFLRIWLKEYLHDCVHETYLLAWLKRSVTGRRDCFWVWAGDSDMIKPVDYVFLGLWFSGISFPLQWISLPLLIASNLNAIKNWGFFLNYDSEYGKTNCLLILIFSDGRYECSHCGAHTSLTFQFSFVKIWKVIKTVIWIKVGRPSLGQISPLLLLILSSWCE